MAIKGIISFQSMPLHPQSEPNPTSIAGVLLLNGVVWSVMVISHQVGVAARGGPYSGLEAIVLCVLAAFFGACANAGFCLWKLGVGNRYQAALYVIGLIPLVAVFLTLFNGLSHIGKIGG